MAEKSEKPENRASLKQDDLIAKLVKDPKAPPDALLLSGLVGASSEEGHSRLYLNGLEDYVEIPNDAILHTQEMPKDQSPLGGSLVWIKSDAELIHGKVGPNRLKAKFLEGRIQQEFVRGQAAAGFAGANVPRTVHAVACSVGPHCPVTHDFPKCNSIAAPCATHPQVCPAPSGHLCGGNPNLPFAAAQGFQQPSVGCLTVPACSVDAPACPTTDFACTVVGLNCPSQRGICTAFEPGCGGGVTSPPCLVVSANCPSVVCPTPACPTRGCTHHLVACTIACTIVGPGCNVVTSPVSVVVPCHPSVAVRCHSVPAVLCAPSVATPCQTTPQSALTPCITQVCVTQQVHCPIPTGLACPQVTLQCPVQPGGGGDPVAAAHAAAFAAQAAPQAAIHFTLPACGGIHTIFACHTQNILQCFPSLLLQACPSLRLDCFPSQGIHICPSHPAILCGAASGGFGCGQQGPGPLNPGAGGFANAAAFGGVPGVQPEFLQIKQTILCPQPHSLMACPTQDIIACHPTLLCPSRAACPTAFAFCPSLACGFGGFGGFN